MPYLPVELDARKAMVKVARFANMSPGDVLWGLTEAWEQVFLTKSDVLDRTVLESCIGPDSRLREALVAHGFLEPVENRWRMRGSERLLGASGQRSNAGKKRTSDAPRDSRGRLLPKSMDVQRPSSVDPALLQRTSSALSSEMPPLDVSLDQREPETSSESSAHPASHQRATSEPPADGPAKLQRSNPTPNTQHLLLKTEAVGPEESLREAWNELTSPPIPRWTKDNKFLRKQARAALKRRPLGEWREVFRRIGASSKCCGQNDLDGWVADAEWALRPAGAKQEPAAKVLEGKWDDREKRGTSPPPAATRTGITEAPGAMPCEACGVTSGGGLVWKHWLCSLHCGVAFEEGLTSAALVEDWLKKRNGEAA